MNLVLCAVAHRISMGLITCVFNVSLWLYYNHGASKYSGVRIIASRILHEIWLLIGELAIRGTKLTLNARLGTKSNLLIEQYCY